MDERLAWFQCVAGASDDMLLVRWWTRAPRWRRVTTSLALTPWSSSMTLPSDPRKWTCHATLSIVSASDDMIDRLATPRGRVDSRGYSAMVWTEPFVLHRIRS